MKSPGTGLARRLRVVWIFQTPLKARDAAARVFRSAVGQEGWLISRELRYAPKPDKGESERGINFGGDKMLRTRNGYAARYERTLLPWVESARTVVELGARS
jgi:hypothetical protein